MSTPQISPGVLIREVDLTVGRADNVLDNIGAIAGPFPTGPVEEVVDITTEQELINVFGKPISTDSQYEYWMSASSFLSYGGILKVVRADNTNLVNANAIRNAAGVSTAGEPDLKIKNFDDYELNYADDIANYVFAAKTPGTWSNDLKVCVIDDKADQILEVSESVVQMSAVGYGVTVSLVGESIIEDGGLGEFTGYLKGIITGVGTSTLDVKITSLVAEGTTTDIPITYQQRNQAASIRPGNEISIITSAGIATTSHTLSSDGTAVKDWYDQQFLDLTNTRILWSSIAPKPTSTQYALDRNAKNDAIHIAIIDDIGKVTGIQGNLLEKHLFLSKAEDAISSVNPSQKNWWKAYLAQFSDYVYSGDNPSDNLNPNEIVYQTGFSEEFTPYTETEGQWNSPAQNKVFSALGNVTYTLTGGKNYNENDGYESTLGDLISSYRLFSNRDEVEVDYLDKAQRDRLYPQRINSIVNQSGIGVILFGDKTALGFASAFDRINVRRLFLTVEQALERSAQAQLFELNDQLTRANFINIVEPYLRDVQAKRGVYDFRVICDETNNTPDVIDNNEFRADIFLKPTKSINYVTLTFVATRTGVSFEEVTGRV
jgi:hypothetical protein